MLNFSWLQKMFTPARVSDPCKVKPPVLPPTPVTDRLQPFVDSLFSGGNEFSVQFLTALTEAIGENPYSQLLRCQAARAKRQV